MSVNGKIGFAAHERIGIGIINPRGASKLSVIPRVCPVCGVEVTDLSKHAEEVGDDAHRVVEVMES